MKILSFSLILFLFANFLLSFQVARRLSFNVSRKASSVYQFFQDKEEFRTAKLTFLVVVVAFICWSPFMGVLFWPLFQMNQTIMNPIDLNANVTRPSPHSNLTNHPAFKSILLLLPSSNVSQLIFMDDRSSLIHIPRSLIDVKHHTLNSESGVEESHPSIFWLHFVSCIMILLFTAISPYVYVFRSKKVQKSLNDIWTDPLFCNLCRPGSSDQLNSPSLASKLSVNNLASSEKEKSCVQSLNGQLTPKINKAFRKLKNKTPTPKEQQLSINRINNNLEIKAIKTSASQSDLMRDYPPSNDERYHIRYVDKNVGGKLSKTFSCPDVLKLPTKVCLESSL